MRNLLDLEGRTAVSQYSSSPQNSSCSRRDFLRLTAYTLLAKPVLAAWCQKQDTNQSQSELQNTIDTKTMDAIADVFARHIHRFYDRATVTDGAATFSEEPISSLASALEHAIDEAGTLSTNFKKRFGFLSQIQPPQSPHDILGKLARSLTKFFNAHDYFFYIDSGYPAARPYADALLAQRIRQQRNGRKIWNKSLSYQIAEIHPPLVNYLQAYAAGHGNFDFAFPGTVAFFDPNLYGHAGALGLIIPSEVDNEARHIYEQYIARDTSGSFDGVGSAINELWEDVFGRAQISLKDFTQTHQQKIRRETEFFLAGRIQFHERSQNIDWKNVHAASGNPQRYDELGRRYAFATQLYHSPIPKYGLLKLIALKELPQYAAVSSALLKNIARVMYESQKKYGIDLPPALSADEKLAEIKAYLHQVPAEVLRAAAKISSQEIIGILARLPKIE